MARAVTVKTTVTSDGQQSSREQTFRLEPEVTLTAPEMLLALLKGFVAEEEATDAKCGMPFTLWAEIREVDA